MKRAEITDEVRMEFLRSTRCQVFYGRTTVCVYSHKWEPQCHESPTLNESLDAAILSTAFRPPTGGNEETANPPKP